MELRFYVPGKPQTAGSKSAYVNQHTGKASVSESGDKESKARKRAWRTDLRDAARHEIPDAVQIMWSVAPVYVRFVFARARPKAHLDKHGAVRERHLRDRPVQRPDALKLARAAEDALTGVVWADDAQIVSGTQDKVYADQVGLDPRSEGVLVIVRDARPWDGPMVAERVEQLAAVL